MAVIRALPDAGLHGGDGPAVAKALGVDVTELLDLSQSLNPFAPDITKLAASRLDSLRYYPNAAACEVLLAAAIGVDPERLLLTNGGSEAITLLTAEVGGTVRSEPEFSLHPRAEGGPIWRSDPHNPSGALATPGDKADVWDEAFYPLSTGSWTAGRSGFVLGSLTKLFACPGLRLGYVIAPDRLSASSLRQLQPEWSVNSLALALLPDLLERSDLPGWASQIARARAGLVALLASHGLPAHPSDAPWVLVNSPGLRERLMPFRVLVRDCTSFGLTTQARIAVTDDAGLDQLDHALQQICATNAP